ncbi:MAG: DUF2442 domain-containing protein [Planctomycetota bacterium]|jgi:hypothetical protein
MLEVAKAKYMEGYRIWIEFNDGTSGTVDLSDALWGPMFEPLKDIELFKNFTVSEVVHTITWENDADLAPEYLYEKLSNSSLQATSQ